MRVWLLTVGEPLPIDVGPPRLLRAGILATRLAREGHDVVWWSSRFNHALKCTRETAGREVTLSDKLRLVLLDGEPYVKNISWARMRNHAQIAREFRRLAASERERPDVLAASYPTIELCYEAMQFGAANGVPAIVDLRDLWPDIFLEVLPTFARVLGKLPLFPLFRKKREIFRKATAIFAMSEHFMEWALASAGRSRTDFDCVFPLAYERTMLSQSEEDEARNFWATQGIDRNSFVICFFGNISQNVLDLDTVIEAAKVLLAQRHNIKFVLCGTGATLPVLKKKAADNPEIVFPGWISAAQIKALMEVSNVGLVPYISRWDFVGSLPNKSIEYLSGGVPIVTCLEGTLQRLVQEEACGKFYPSRDSRALAELLLALSNDPLQMQAMAANAHRIFTERFDAYVVYARYIAQMEQLATTNLPKSKIEH